MADSSWDPTNESSASTPEKPTSDLDRRLRQQIADEGLTTARTSDTLLRLSVLAGCVAGAAWCAARTAHPAAWAFAMLVSTAALVSLPFAVHEAIHGSLFRRRSLNHVAGVVLGALTLVHFAPYRTLHLEHHRLTHMLGDPEPSAVIRSRSAYVFAVLGALPAFSLGLAVHLARSIAGRPVSWYRRTRRIGLDVASFAAVVALIALATAATLRGHLFELALLWLVPAVLALMLGGIFAVPEHYGCDYGPASPFRTSRTTATSRAVRALVWNGNFHTAHHLVPSVTAPNLPRLHELIANRCEHTARSYTRFHAASLRSLSVGEIVPAPPWSGTEQVIDLRDQPGAATSPSGAEQARSIPR